MTREQLAMVVHATINRMENFDPVGVELLHVQPWAALDDRQKEYCARIGEAVSEAIEIDNLADKDRSLCDSDPGYRDEDRWYGGGEDSYIDNLP